MSSFFDFETGCESSYGFASPLNNIKNGTFDIFYSNTIKLLRLVKFCCRNTSLADFRGL